jgi:general L-amino acid transport system substrate-binding protein
MLHPAISVKAFIAKVLLVVCLIGAGGTSGHGEPAGSTEQALPETTLHAVKARGALRCGVSTGLAGFSMKNADGEGWTGFDVDYCRALAAAVLGDAHKVDYLPFPIQKGLTALSRGEIDVLSRTVTITLRRITGLGLHPVGVNYFDGQSFLLKREAGVRTLRQLAGHSICFQNGTTAGDNLKEHFNARHIGYTPVGRDDFKGLIQTFLEGGCDALTADASSLASIRITALRPPDRYVILRQHISKEPFGPVIRKGDDQWLEIARWTLAAMIEAEELGISRATLDSMHTSDNPRVRRLLGLSPEPGPGLGVALGLDDGWADRIVAQVGNYGESFEANLGATSPLKLDRGLNELWTRGGLLFAFPLR